MDERDEKKLYKREQRRQREADVRRVEFIKAAMQYPQGREFFYWLLSITGLKANPFAQNALTMSFNCGMMNVGQMIEGKVIESAPELYLEMLKEQENARSNPLTDSESGDADPE